MMEVDIFVKFPLLTLWIDRTYWSGFLKVGNDLVRLAVDVPNYPSMKAAVLHGDEDSASLLSQPNNQKEIEKLVNSECSLLEFLESFADLVKKTLDAKSKGTVDIVNPDVYLRIFNEIQQIGMDNISYFSDDLKEIHITLEDPSGRSHTLKVFVPNGYPHENVKIQADLPSTEVINWPTRITSIFSHFEKVLEKFDSFWMEMDEIDSNVQVLDPFQPSRAHTHRRIMLENQVILHFILNPVTPRRLPEIRFHGPDDAADGFDKEFTKNCKKWSVNYSVLENLQALIPASFPCKGEGALTEDEVNCIICYSYELDGDVPETVCVCKSFFHSKCLNELYLNEMSSNMGKTNAVDCPVCSMEIKLNEKF